MVVLDAIGARKPRIRSVPRYRRTRGEEALEVAELAGLVLDDWQKDTLVDACGIRKDGRWTATEVGLNIARQNGKTVLLAARELASIFAFGSELVIHSAHEFATATEAFLKMQDYLDSSDELRREVRTINRSHGHEGFVFQSGQRLLYKTRTGSSARGFSCDLLILDEAMILKEAFMGALEYTLSGRSMQGNPQMWYAGSAVDQAVHEHGVVFARVRERGIAGDPALAWFEWSAEVTDDAGETISLDLVDDEALSDLDAWAQANPGLGARISPEWVERELRSRAARTFAVERLGIGDWPSTEAGAHGPIGIREWDALADPESRITGSLAFAFDVTPDRRSASICAAGERPDGHHVEVVDRRPGTGWLAKRLAQLAKKHNPVALVCDGASPAASLIPELEEAGLEVEKLDARSHANACGLFFDAVDQETLAHLGTAELRAAIKGSAARPLGEAWAWSRKTSGVDISPLVACTLALWGVETMTAAQPWSGAW